jgi:hypothetical protein
MKKELFLMASVSLLAAATFYACDKKDDDDNNNGGKETSEIASGEHNITYTEYKAGNGGLDFDSVRVGSNYSYGSNATFDKSSSSLTFNLPKGDVIGADDLDSLFSASNNERRYSGLTKTNEGVKVSFAGIYSYKKGDLHFSSGRFFHGTNDDSDWEGVLVYADGDASVTGTKNIPYEEESSTVIPATFSVKLVKGWNILYIKDRKDAYEETTKEPAGAKWYYFY